MKSNSAISESRLIIAIDGPAGSGKSTTAQLLAEKLNYLYLDTGALYRAFTLKVVKTGLGKGQEGEIVALL
ncbi:MAG: (d)CMP kinase, partial [bacterium]